MVFDLKRIGLRPAGRRWPGAVALRAWAFLLLALVLVSGCRTDESSRPWNRPTRFEQSRDWWFQGDYNDLSHGHYP